MQKKILLSVYSLSNDFDLKLDQKYKQPSHEKQAKKGKLKSLLSKSKNQLQELQKQKINVISNNKLQAKLNNPEQLLKHRNISSVKKGLYASQALLKQQSTNEKTTIVPPSRQSLRSLSNSKKNSIDNFQAQQLKEISFRRKQIEREKSLRVRNHGKQQQFIHDCHWDSISMMRQNRAVSSKKQQRLVRKNSMTTLSDIKFKEELQKRKKEEEQNLLKAKKEFLLNKKSKAQKSKLLGGLLTIKSKTMVENKSSGKKEFKIIYRKYQ